MFHQLLNIFLPAFCISFFFLFVFLLTLLNKPVVPFGRYCKCNLFIFLPFMCFFPPWKLQNQKKIKYYCVYMYMFLVECLFGVCRTKQISDMVKKIGMASWQKENLDRYLLQYSTLFCLRRYTLKLLDIIL